MCSNHSPSEKHDGTVDVPELCDLYDQHVEAVEQLPLATYRVRSLTQATRRVREALAADGAVSPARLQTLVCVIAEATGDVEQSLRRPDGTADTAGVAHEMPPGEQATCLDALSQLQFAVVETPVAVDGD